MVFCSDKVIESFPTVIKVMADKIEGLEYSLEHERQENYLLRQEVETLKAQLEDKEAGNG